jgi:hypothetical protein
VRSAPFFAIIAVGIFSAVEQLSFGQSLEQRLIKPDKEKVFNLEQLTPFGRSKSEFQARGANTNSFYFQQKFQPKGYQTESFETKSSRYTDFKFATKDARTKSFETKSAPVKTAPVKDAREGSKTAATSEFSEANRTSGFKGRNQALFDKEGPAAQAKIGPGFGGSRFSIPGGPESASWAGDLKQLTVEDIREILNKNK